MEPGLSVGFSGFSGFLLPIRDPPNRNRDRNDGSAPRSPFSPLCGFFSASIMVHGSLLAWVLRLQAKRILDQPKDAAGYGHPIVSKERNDYKGRPKSNEQYSDYLDPPDDAATRFIHPPNEATGFTLHVILKVRAFGALSPCKFSAPPDRLAA
jgi:hypothetical protein